ncbi:hypothetical protein QE152_g24490 [Popillia japonica]|uniref:Reverse transcriptase domain-containing protein n=1 Tax=Popillia japonica TaxID=7064 RepID=A0AAW1KBM6_POPJA
MWNETFKKMQMTVNKDFSSSGKDLQHNLNMWNETFKKMQMTVNKDKTKVMVLGKEEEHINIEIDGQILEQVNTFKYLGVQIDSQGRGNIEVEARIDQTVKLYHSLNRSFLNQREISKKTKMSVYKSVYRPTLTFGRLK